MNDYAMRCRQQVKLFNLILADFHQKTYIRGGRTHVMLKLLNC